MKQHNSFSTFIIIRNVYWAANQHIRMISEGSCDTKDWRNYAENSALITAINYIVLYIRIEDSCFNIIYFTVPFTVFFIIKIICILFFTIGAIFLKIIDVKLLQKKDKYCIWPIKRHHKNSPHSALSKSSRRYQSIVSYRLIIFGI